MQSRPTDPEPTPAVFRALADQTRRDILRLLREDALTSGEIAAAFDSSWPTISRHLAVLRDAGLVVAERYGQEIRYELNTTVFEDLVQHFLEWLKPEARNVEAKESRRSSRRVRSQRGGLLPAPRSASDR
ncbi:MAG: autorepressor SdpR family transcription factor [Gemmatimonadota bacterium]